MKKLVMTVMTLAMLSTPSFAENNTERMDELRKQFLMMTDQMMNDQMAIMKMQEAMITNYQRLVKQMMENENSGN